MPVGFGFSVGDFLAAVQLIYTVAGALQQTSRSSIALQDIQTELGTLKTTLELLQRLTNDDDQRQRSEIIAVRELAAKCQHSIAEDPFSKTVVKYATFLQPGGSGSKVKDGWAKVIWATLKKGELESFQVKLRGHATSLTIALLAAQLNASSVQERQQKSRYKSLAASVQDTASRYLQKLFVVNTTLNEGVQQIIRTNLQIFTTIQAIHQYILQVPRQVERQQPVYMIDALGKYSPFHLEFVRSAEALKAILKANMRASGCGPAMIEGGQFVIEDAATQSDIDLNAPWDNCFFPGQRVAMSMLFVDNAPRSGNACPNCSQPVLLPSSGDIGLTCSTCNTVFSDRYFKVDAILKSEERHVVAERTPSHCSITLQAYQEAELRLNMRKFRRLRLLRNTETTRNSRFEQSHALIIGGDDLTAINKVFKEKRIRRRREEKLKRMAHLGLHENRIECNPKSDTLEPAFRAHKSFKVHKDYLDVATLKYFNIPYDDKSEADYIIILQEMDQDETEVLFEHTGRLRAGMLLSTDDLDEEGGI